jgi:pyruvate dehydrogenase E2 component (dihydrolipoamide acetyltransferase)
MKRERNEGSDIRICEHILKLGQILRIRRDTVIIEVRVPKWGLTMENGEMVKWLKNEGDKVEKGEQLVEMMTDKITNYIEVPESGVLKRILAKEGESVQVLAVIAEIEIGEG